MLPALFFIDCLKIFVEINYLEKVVVNLNKGGVLLLPFSIGGGGWGLA